MFADWSHQCDENRPACSRCVRTNRQCTGYRDTNDLMFRHTTARTSKKKVRPPGTVLGPQTHPSRSHDHFEKEGYHLPRSPRRTLLPSNEDQRLCFFYQTIMENLVDLDHTRYLHAQLPTLLSRSRAGSALHWATQAISYATWKKSRSRVCDEGSNAGKLYAQALSALSEAIRDPVEAKSDETLYTVLLLSGYEVNTIKMLRRALFSSL